MITNTWLQFTFWYQGVRGFGYMLYICHFYFSHLIPISILKIFLYLTFWKLKLLEKIRSVLVFFQEKSRGITSIDFQSIHQNFDSVSRFSGDVSFFLLVERSPHKQNRCSKEAEELGHARIFRTAFKIPAKFNRAFSVILIFVSVDIVVIFAWKAVHRYGIGISCTIQWPLSSSLKFQVH